MSSRRRRGEPAVPVVVADRRRVEFHFPVEIHMEEPGEPVDVHALAEQVFQRLARRIDES